MSEYRNRGTLAERYAIYCAACADLGIPPLSFDDWLNS